MTRALPMWLRVGAVATTFFVGRLVAGLILAVWSVGPLAFDAPGEVVAALAVGMTAAWLAPRVTGSRRPRIGALGLVAFTSVAAVMLEGSAFAPELSPPALLPVGLLLQLGVCVVAVGVAIAMSPEPATRTPRRRPLAPTFAWRVLAASAVYVAAYFVTGAVSYLLVTGPYYETHAGGLVRPEPSLVLAVALIEGLLLALGATPLARMLTGSTRARATACGVVLWVLGGIVPLLQVTSLPDVLRLASAVEILFQKVPLGMAVVWLLAPADREAQSGLQSGS